MFIHTFSALRVTSSDAYRKDFIYHLCAALAPKSKLLIFSFKELIRCSKTVAIDNCRPPHPRHGPVPIQLIWYTGSVNIFGQVWWSWDFCGRGQWIQSQKIDGTSEEGINSINKGCSWWACAMKCYSYWGRLSSNNKWHMRLIRTFLYEDTFVCGDDLILLNLTSPCLIRLWPYYLRRINVTSRHNNRIIECLFNYVNLVTSQAMHIHWHKTRGIIMRISRWG